MCRNIHKTAIQLLFVHLWFQTSAHQQLSFMSCKAHLSGWSLVQQVWFQSSFLQGSNSFPVFLNKKKTGYEPIRLLPLLPVSKGLKVPNRNDWVTLTKNAEAGLRVFSRGVSSKASGSSRQFSALLPQSWGRRGGTGIWAFTEGRTCARGSKKEKEMFSGRRMYMIVFEQVAY